MSSDLLFRFEYPPSEDDPDRRTLTVLHTIDESQSTVELYKFRHPNIDINTGVTSIQRLNTETGHFENAGHIEWSSMFRGHVYFGGVEKVSILELRRQKKPSSDSRRFKANGSEYKWKLAENGKDMICVSEGNLAIRGKTIAQWTDDTLTLQVARRAEDFLDRVIVTCFLHLWFRRFEHGW